MKKLEIENSIKEEIINKYNSGISMGKMKREYPFSFNVIQKIIKSYESEEKIKLNYPQKEGYNMIAVCNKTKKEIFDYKNMSGAIATHIFSLYPEEKLKSKFIRKSKEYETGKFWYDEYFNFEYRLIPQIKKCGYCDWTTEDIDNKSGAYKKHLLLTHGIVIDNHVKEHKEDIGYFKKITPDDAITCKICGKKLRILNHKHLRKHNISVYEYKLKYDQNIVSNTTKNKLFKSWNTSLKNLEFRNISSHEKTIMNKLSEINFITNDRKILNGLEIDLLSIENKIGIEIDGLYYHSEITGKKNRTYHINKTNVANEKGIKLIHIFEDEITYKEEIVINKLKHIFNIGTLEKIHGRKCIIREISIKEKTEFAINYHIQGDSMSTHNLGAYYHDELVAIMLFNNKRNMNKEIKHTPNIYELCRFVTKFNYIINGIASKMLSYFVKKYKPEKILSFADRRWTLDSTDNLYTKLGFSLIKILPPDYSYINCKIRRVQRFHKFGYGKSSLKKYFPEIYDENKTEWEMMQELGYDRIWDCGKYKYELNFQKNI